MNHFVWAVLPHVLASMLAGLLCIRFIGPWGFMDMPGGRRSHSHPIPLVGGMAFFVCLPLSLLLTRHPIPMTRIEWSVLSIMVLIGVLDDRLELKARWKALAGFLIALVLTGASTSHHIGHPNPLHLLCFSIPRSPSFITPLLLAYFWGIPQAINLIDGANGLAVGFSLIITSILVMAGGIPLFIPALLAGVLLLNWPKARLFLGDCGSLGLGLMLAILAHRVVVISPNNLLWLFAYPILDVTLVSTIRVVTGRHPFDGDCNHMHHQLQQCLGNRQFWAVPLLWLSSGLSASRILFPAGPWLLLPHLGLSILVALFIGFLIRSLVHNRQNQLKSLSAP